MGNDSIELFREACGARRPLELRIRSLADERENYLEILPSPFAVIGRDPRADVVLRHESISRRHAYLQEISGRVYCVDLGSRTGIRWGQEAATSGWLNPGCTVEIGPYLIELVRGGEGEPGNLGELAMHANPLEPWPAGQVSRDKVSLEILNRTGGPSIREVRRTLSLLGRARECKPRLADPGVSFFHCGLLQTPMGLWMVDLLGRGGVKVGDTVVRSARLDHGDQFRVGGFKIRLHDESNPQGRGWLGAGRPETPTSLAPMAWGPNEIDRPSPSSSNVLAALSQTGSSMAARRGKQGEILDSHLVPLVQQFGQMQQSMFDQFQQAMMLMFQMFGTMHRDQMAELREELAQIRRLTQELGVMQSASNQYPDPLPNGAPLVRPIPPEAVASSPCVDDPSALAGSARSHAPERANAIPENRGERQTSESPRPRTATIGAAQAGGPAARTSVDNHAADSAEDIHAILCRKIAEIQNERQTRFQKILNIVMGT